MILLDYSGTCMSAFFSMRQDTVDEAMLRHLILNMIRSYNVKYRAKFGKMIIACDGGSWRKEVFAEYKGVRKVNREESAVDWDDVWRVFGVVLDEIRNNMPYKVVRVKGAEADDIIATLVETTQEFGNGEPVMIVSADKDFIQLQKYTNVSQFSPMTKKLVTDKNPRRYLMEHILRGCTGDGVPNVLSDDDTFVNAEKRQGTLRAKVVTEWIESFSKLEQIMPAETYKKFVRNQRCIDLSFIPDEVSNAVLAEYDAQPVTPNSKVFSYLISKQCKLLIGSANDFFPPKV